MSRKERKQLDRELPWREIMKMHPSHIDKFLQAIGKEESSWMEWQSIRPLTDEEFSRVKADPKLRKRLLRSRAVYRDKNRNVGEVKAKCRVVALGHNDPDLFSISRDAPTPGRLSEHVIMLFLVAGMNQEVQCTGLSWVGWLADASTAFLQGSQPDDERSLPLYLLPPDDGLIRKTNCWKAKAYQVTGNIYGLPNAPRLWAQEVVGRLEKCGYERHSFDKMLFMKFTKPDLEGNRQILSLILVYVDDFLGTYRQDYDPSEVYQAFKWGSINTIQENVAVTFKGKELTLLRNAKGRFTLKVTMKSFIDEIEQRSLARGRMQADLTLSPEERTEFRSISGCLQWASTQARPDVSAVVSLTNGSNIDASHLKTLYETAAYLKSTATDGLLFQDIAMNAGTVLLTYTDASWANAAKGGSQLGILVTVTSAPVTQVPSKVSVIDWRSCRSPRICRSTLAAEASSADEGSDRSAFANMYISQILFATPAHRVGCRLNFLQATDAKSLFDAVVAQNPSLADRRSMINIRAIQETVTEDQFRWIPTTLMYADGLTKIDRKLQEAFRTWLQGPIAQLRELPKKEPSVKESSM